MSQKSSIVVSSVVIAALLLFCTIPLLAEKGAEQRESLDHCVAGVPQPVFTAIPGEDTEGVAVAPNGDVFTAEMYSGKIYRIKPNGYAEVIATLFVPGAYPSLTVLGVVFGPERNVYVIANTWDSSTHGVWRVHPKNGVFELYAAIPPTGSFLNAMTFDDQGNLFVTDSFLGAIWKVSVDGEVEFWLSSDLLVWRDDPFSPPFGANGIAYWDKTLYVAVTLAGEAYLPEIRGRNFPVVKVPVRRDGSAGKPKVFLSDEVLLAPDGLAVDRLGRLYVVDFGGLYWGPGFPHAGPAKLVRVHLDGTEEVVASAGLENAASVAVRDRTAYVTNLYVSRVPNIVKIDLCANHSDHRSDSDEGD
jgi:sugar lactone lactonase YvrE